MAATLTTSENAAFDALCVFVWSLFDVADQQNIFKGYQNMTATPDDPAFTGTTYAVISPGIKQRVDRSRNEYRPDVEAVDVHRGTTYSYQIDCYGPNAPDWADIIAVAWQSLWGCDQMEGKPLTPLYADDAQQLNISNGEHQYEQRFMIRLFGFIDTVVTLPQDFFTGPIPTEIKIPADYLPP